MTIWSDAMLGVSALVATAIQSAPRSLTYREVRQIVRLSKKSITEMRKRGDFPQPIRVGLRKFVWPEGEIQVWMEGRRVST